MAGFKALLVWTAELVDREIRPCSSASVRRWSFATSKTLARSNREASVGISGNDSLCRLKQLGNYSHIPGLLQSPSSKIVGPERVARAPVPK